MKDRTYLKVIKTGKEQHGKIPYEVWKIKESKIYAYPHPIPPGFDMIRTTELIACGTADNLEVVIDILRPLCIEEQIHAWIYR